MTLVRYSLSSAVTPLLLLTATILPAQTSAPNARATWLRRIVMRALS